MTIKNPRSFGIAQFVSSGFLVFLSLVVFRDQEMVAKVLLGFGFLDAMAGAYFLTREESPSGPKGGPKSRPKRPKRPRSA